MKLHVSAPTRENTFTGYGTGYVLINGKRHEANLVLTPDQIVESWGAPGFEGLTEEHFELIVRLQPEILLFGSGPTFRLPHPRLTKPLALARIGMEAMDTHAACRTYNILMAEGRRVAAAILIA